MIPINILNKKNIKLSFHYEHFWYMYVSEEA
jgi:hypothetical protein